MDEASGCDGGACRAARHRLGGPAGRRGPGRGEPRCGSAVSARLVVMRLSSILHDVLLVIRQQFGHCHQLLYERLMGKQNKHDVNRLKNLAKRSVKDSTLLLSILAF